MNNNLQNLTNHPINFVIPNLFIAVYSLTQSLIPLPIINQKNYIVTQNIEREYYMIWLESRHQELHLLILLVQYPKNIFGFEIVNSTFLILTVINIEINTIKSREIRSRVCDKLHGKPKYISLRPIPIIYTSLLFLTLTVKYGNGYRKVNPKIEFIF